MRIPQVRLALTAAADELRAGADPLKVANEIDRLVTELWRKKAKRRVANPNRVRLTPEKKAEIRAYVRAHKDMDLQEIGNHFNVNSGRISEIVSGVRE